MRILAIDTSTRTASVAVLGGTREVEIDREVGPGRGEGQAREARSGVAPARARQGPTVHGGSHSDDLIALIDRALSDAGLTLGELDAVAVGAGPGSFTGLRIAMATAKGLCFASGLPLWPVSSLAALALDAAAALAAADPPEDPSGALLVPLFDARRDEVFAGLYRAEADRVIAIAEDSVMPIAEVGGRVNDALSRTASSRAILVGDALSAHGAALAAAGEVVAGMRSTPSARSVGRLAALGDHIDALKAGTPVYIRPSEAEVVFPNGNPGGHPASTRTRKE